MERYAMPRDKMTQYSPPPKKKSFGPELISRFVAYKMKYQHSFSVSCQADSQIYAEDEKLGIVITPKKKLPSWGGWYAPPVMMTYYQLIILRKFIKVIDQEYGIRLKIQSRESKNIDMTQPTLQICGEMYYYINHTGTFGYPCVKNKT